MPLDNSLCLGVPICKVGATVLLQSCKGFSCKLETKVELRKQKPNSRGRARRGGWHTSSLNSRSSRSSAPTPSLRPPPKPSVGSLVSVRQASPNVLPGYPRQGDIIISMLKNQVLIILSKNMTAMKGFINTWQNYLQSIFTESYLRSYYFLKINKLRTFTLTRSN